MKKDYGKPLFADIKYCTRCCLPETSAMIEFDELGICSACQSSEHKMHIDWAQRQKTLRDMLEHHKQKAGDNYDCIIPISGGKDSIFQLHVLTRVYGMRPLTVTFNHNWFTEAGKRNLERCLEKLDLDHIMYTPRRSLVNKLAKRSLHLIGDICWHCHTGVHAFPLQVAVKWKIPLIIFGESAAEFSGQATYKDNPKFDPEYHVRYSAMKQPKDMVDGDIIAKDFCFFHMPTSEEMKKEGITRIFLGDYMFWDLERQTEFVIKEYGWEEDIVDGTYKRYKSVECIMPGVHDYAKFVKRGFGRGTDFACQDVRTGLMTREEGFELAKEYDQARPKMLDHYLKMTGMTEEEFLNILKSHRRGPACKLPDIKKAGQKGKQPKAE